MKIIVTLNSNNFLQILVFIKVKEFTLILVSEIKKITFCAVGVHHQNGVAERFIETIIDLARNNL